ncbi:hypothetical protein [Tabrizicola sp.]|uniref:hypothetical protein n=1 Tax=Tabrizicola sp. TaxID=2005166 RepID=UPI003F358985
MLTVEFLRVALILTHLLAFAVAICLVLREDIRLLMSRRLNLEELQATAHNLTLALIALFVTGALLVWVDTGFDPAVMATKPKLLAKFTVVGVLTLNGLILHFVIFPRLARSEGTDLGALPYFAAALGAVSSVSWIFASFLGVAKPLTESFGYLGFITLYAEVLAAGVLFATIVLGPHVRRLILAEQRGDPFARLLTLRRAGGRVIGNAFQQPVFR